MILEECEHVLADVGCLLKGRGDVVYVAAVLADGTQCVVESHLVVKVVETSLIDETAIKMGLVDFSDEDDSRILGLHLRHCPLPEGYGGELHHVAAEAVYSL